MDNYGGGSLSAVPIKIDGSLGSDLQTVRHQGKSIGRGQDKPHVHAAVLSPNGCYLFVPDLRTDKVNIYTVDFGKSEPLAPADPAFIRVKSGSGPRHFIFHPNGRFAYVIDRKGKLSFKDRQSTLGKTPRNFALDPTGNFLLVGNSGDDEIVIFKRNKKTGSLTPTGKKIKVGAPVCLKFVAAN